MNTERKLHIDIIRVDRVSFVIILKRLDVGMECLLVEISVVSDRTAFVLINFIHTTFIHTTIIDNCIEFNIPLYVNFIDFKAAFDFIRREFIWSSVRHYGLTEKYVTVRIFEAFSNRIMSFVRVNGEVSDWFSVDLSNGQGDIQGPPIFNFCLKL